MVATKKQQQQEPAPKRVLECQKILVCDHEFAAKDGLHFIKSYRRIGIGATFEIYEVDVRDFSHDVPDDCRSDESEHLSIACMYGVLELPHGFRFRVFTTSTTEQIATDAAFWMVHGRLF